MQNRVREAIARLRSYTDLVPEAAVVLGSGLGAFADSLDKKIIIPTPISPGGPCLRRPAMQEDWFSGIAPESSSPSCRGECTITRAVPWKK